jgi:UDP-3-O-[3-hydroxymyristoyl] glucosamine N-acyltransferase
MNFPNPLSLREVANLIQADAVGPDDFPVTGINEIHKVAPGDLVFVDHPKYYDKALQSAATTILINKMVPCPDGKALLLSDDPFRDFNKITKAFRPFVPATSHIGEGSLVDPTAIIQPNVFIGNHVTIGANTILHPGVVIHDYTVIGNDVVIQANTVIGGDAFYYKKRETGYDRLLSGGYVHIGDRVEIGCGCTIDRGVSGDTRIGAGTKIDNLVQIGHDTEIGENCLFASQVGIAGCVKIGDHVTIWGQVGVTSGISIGDKVVILAQSGISKSLEAGKTYFGYPAEEARKKYRELASIRILPQIISRLDLEE